MNGLVTKESTGATRLAVEANRALTIIEGASVARRIIKRLFVIQTTQIIKNSLTNKNKQHDKRC